MISRCFRCVFQSHEYTATPSMYILQNLRYSSRDLFTVFRNVAPAFLNPKGITFHLCLNTVLQTFSSTYKLAGPIKQLDPRQYRVTKLSLHLLRNRWRNLLLTHGCAKKEMERNNATYRLPTCNTSICIAPLCQLAWDSLSESFSVPCSVSSQFIYV